MLKKWKKISSEDKFKNPWWTYRLDKFELPSGKQGEYHYMHTLDAVYILPVLEDGRVIWVKQYRYLFDRESIEVVAGRVEGDEDLEVAAHRELIEETGFDGDLTKVGSCACEIGLDDSSMHIFVARN